MKQLEKRMLDTAAYLFDLSWNSDYKIYQLLVLKTLK